MFSLGFYLKNFKLEKISFTETGDRPDTEETVVAGSSTVENANTQENKNENKSENKNTNSNGRALFAKNEFVR